MGLDIIEEKNLTDVITYSLDYPRVVLTEAKPLAPNGATLPDFAFGLYIGYISGVFFDGFLRRNKRFLNEEEMSSFHSVLFNRTPEIWLKIKAYLKLK
jgi:hypothetical protein